MAIDNRAKDPRTTTGASQPDVEVTPEKRRISELLPIVNRTDTIKKFFDGSVDHFFQPSDFKKISGFIGRKPGYWDPEKEFYLDEITQPRRDYQLEPAAISKSSTGDITNVMFYQDIVNHLRFQGGLTANHNRLFEQEYYSWSPPINLDMLTAYWNYFWLPEGPNLIEITDPTDVENDLLGRQYPDESDPVFGTNGVASATSGLRIVLRDDVTAAYNDIIYTIECVGRKIILVEETTSESSGTSSTAAWDSPPGPPWDTAGHDLLGAEVTDPDYIVMERGAKDGNPWSRRNRWFHRDVIVQSGTTVFTDIANLQATRPIIEFVKDIELYNYNTETLAEVDLVYEGTDVFSHLNGITVWIPGDFSNPDPRNSTGEDWSRGQHGLYEFESYIDSNGTARVDIDGFRLVRDGMKILVTSDSNAAVNNKIYEIGGIQSTGVINLIDSGLTATNGSQVKVRYGNSFAGGVFIYNGIEWIEGQRKVSINQPPLFKLYDMDQVKIDDEGVYPNSTFEGNQLFSYQPNPNGTEDSVLGISLTYDEFGEIVYENFIVTDRYEYSSDPVLPIIGYHFYRVVGDTESEDVYSNGWNQITTRTQQYVLFETYVEEQNPFIQLPILPGDQEEGGLPTSIVYVDGVRLDESEYEITDGVTTPIEIRGPVLFIQDIPGNFVQVKLFNKDYMPAEDEYLWWEIPLNLQANPVNLEVQTISTGQYFDHFGEIINNQENLEGDAYGINNWRDTAQNRSFGRQIMQHRAPMLRLMITGSTEDLDFMLSSRYVEREYQRMRNKLIQKFNQFNLNGTYHESRYPDANSQAEAWVDDALEQINTGKTNSFPFYYSNMIEEGSFIPSTPSALGVYKVFKPEAYLDNTFTTPTLTIRGHDGSQYIMFGQINGGGPTNDPADCLDARDRAYLQLENEIYEGIPAGYKSEELSDYNYQEFVPGKFRSTDYTRDEVITLSQPMFERWIAVKGANYRTNDTWSPDNKFTWNYHNSLDRDGDRVPGYWRGMYSWYFDTDRPHTHPWEMLGFSEQPDWWVTQYGTAPWTGGNTLMWQDLEEGRIRQGPREGIDELYARPGLTSFIPVDPSGNLLDPVACGIILQNPTYDQGTTDWVFGDGSPIENVWRKSEAFPFAVAQISYLMKPARFIELGWDPNRYEFKFEDTSAFQWVNIETRDRPMPSDLFVHGETLSDGTVYIGSGIHQWISDWVTSRGQNVTTQFGDIMRGLTVQLSHKMGGYTREDNLRLLTDNFGLIPSEDIDVELNLSPSVREAIYSGVIIEWTGTGWAVFGYDILDPVFNTIPGDPNGRKTLIKVGEPEIELPDIWQGNTAYTDGQRVRYQGIIYQATESHTSGSIFERDRWSYIGSESPDQGIRVQEYLDPNLDRTVLRVPYGTEFKTQQSLYNFLIDYERWLKSEGWIFDEFNQDTNDIMNWRRSGKEYLSWSLNSWTAGSFISLSPIANQVKFTASHGAIQSVEELIRGVYPLLDKAGAKINPRDTAVTRFEDTLQVVPENASQGIYACRISIKESEHILTVNNTTIFNDLIYDVLFNVRQPRFKINGILSKFWNGRLDATGFIVDDNTIYANLEKTVTDFEAYFAIENSPSNPELRDHARHLTGYQFREYLQNLLVDPDVSFQFYQGMIQAKGTPASLGELIKTERTADQEKLDFFEEWAFRLGNFGATEIRPSIEFQLDRSEIRNNPQLIEFSSAFIFDNPFDRSIQLGTDDERWLRKPLDIDNIWPDRGTFADEQYDYPDAGYVRIDEVTYYFTNTDSLIDGFDEFTEGGSVYNERDTLWLYETQLTYNPGEFGVMRVTNTGVTMDIFSPGGSTVITLSAAPTPALNTNPSVLGVEYSEDNIETLRQLYRDGSLGVETINPGDLILINEEAQTSPNLQGIHRVTKISSATEFEIELDIDAEFDYTTQPDSLSSGPTLFVLQDMRVPNIDKRSTLRTALNASGTPLEADEIVWVDDSRSVQEVSDGLEPYWRVYSYDGIDYNNTLRTQNLKVDTNCIVNGTIYDKRTNRVTAWLEAYDPKKGILPGVADKELWYKLEYDPAKYTDGDEDIHQIDPERSWGANELGRLWWNISSVKFLDYEIDDHIYRERWWGAVAPGTTIDIYEWIRSTTPPTDFSSAQGSQTRPQQGASTRVTGEPLNSDNPAWVTKQEWDSRAGQEITVYYFWARNVETVPSVPFRRISSVAVSNIITNPTAAGINWFCPISDQAMILGNSEQFLVDEDTVLQINWKDLRNKYSTVESTPSINVAADIDLQRRIETFCNDPANIHRQWELLREGDRSSLPADELWRKLRDSLVGYNEEIYNPTTQEQEDAILATVDPVYDIVETTVDDEGNTTIVIYRPVPDPNLSEVERYGTLFRPRQTWFADLFEARQVFVQKANDLLLAENIVSTRDDWDKQLFEEEPEPSEDGTTYNINAISAIVSEYTVPQPFSNVSQVSVSTLLNGELTQGVEYNAILTNKIQFTAGNNPIAGDIIYVTVKTWDYKVVDLAARDALIGTIIPGQAVLVEANSETAGRWTVWLYDPSAPPIPTWKLLDTQEYKVEETWDYADWYAAGYSEDTEIDTTYPDLAAFNSAQLTEDFSDGEIIRVEDNGQGKWELYVHTFDQDDNQDLFLEPGTFTKIGEERGTIQLNDIFYTYDFNAENDIYGFDSSAFEAVPFDSLAESLPYPFRELATIIDALREDILINLEVNLLFFAMIRYVHSEQNMIDWVFKTSYIYLIGTEEELSQLPLLRDDVTDDFIDYINEAKPYHVKIRDYQQNKRVPDETYNVLCTDFDNPPYFDEEQDAWRPLELENPDDLSIISSTRPWSEWYEDYLAGSGPSGVGPNVRKFTTRLTYDRVKCWTDSPINGSQSNQISFVANAPAGEYTLFTIVSSKVTITEVRLHINNPTTSSHVGDGIQKTFGSEQIIRQAETLTVTVNSIVRTPGAPGTGTFEIVENGLAIRFHNPPNSGDDIEITVDETFDDINAYLTIGDDALPDNSKILSISEGSLNFVGDKVFPKSTLFNYDANIIVNFQPILATKGIVEIEVDYELAISLADFNIEEFDAADRVALLYDPSLDREKKVIELQPGQDRIKGTTLTTSDLVSDGTYRSRYTVSPIAECEYQGVIHEGFTFVSGGFDTEPFNVLPFDEEGEQSDDELDVILNGGLDVFDIYTIIALSGWDTLIWDRITVTIGATIGWDNEFNLVYTIPGTFNNPSQVSVSVEGQPPLTQGTHYIAQAPDQIIFIGDVSKAGIPSPAPYINGESIFINGNEVFLTTGTDVASAVIDINAANIPGTSAQEVSGALVITSSGFITLLEGSGSAMLTLFGITSFSESAEGIPTTGEVFQVVIAPLGTTFSPAPLEESDIVVEGHQFLQPYYGDDHPEELIKVAPYSSLWMNVFYESAPGCPIIMSDRIISDGITNEYELMQVPQNSEAVWVYIAGKFARVNIDYVFEQDTNSIKFTTVPNSGTPIKLTTFSPGGHRIEQQLFDLGDGTANQRFYLNRPTIMQNITAFINGESVTFTLNWDATLEQQYVEFTVDPTVDAQVQITVFEPFIEERQFDDNGQDTFTLTTTPVVDTQIQVLVNNVPSGFVLSGQDVLIVPAPVAGNDVLVTVYETAKISTIQTDTFTATTGGPELFVLSSPIETTKPRQSTVFVRRNGLRLMPEDTQYETASNSQTAYVFDEIVDTSSTVVRVWVDDTLLAQGVDYTFNFVSGTTADRILFTTPLSAGQDIAVIVDEDIAEFEVINSTTIQVNTLVPGDIIQVSYFTFDDSYKIKTQRYIQNIEGEYPLAQSPYGGDYIWVHVNGERKLLQRDYLIRETEPGFDTQSFNTAGFDDEDTGESTVIMNPFLGIISQYGTEPTAILDESGCVVTSPDAGWDTQEWDAVVDNTLPPPPTGPEVNVVKSFLWDCGLHDPAKLWFDVYGFDSEIWGLLPKDDIVITTIAGPPVEKKFAYSMFKDKFDDLSFTRISDPHKLVLRQELLLHDQIGDKDKEIIMDVNPDLHISMIPDNLLYEPTGTVPGVLYIEGERIEYWEVEKLTDISTGRPYYRIPYKEVTYSTPPRIDKLPKFLRKTKATPAYDEYPIGTIVVPAGPEQAFNLPFTQAEPVEELGDFAIEMPIITSIIVADGVSVLYPAPVIPTYATITSVWTIVGSNRELRTDYTLTADSIIFDSAPGLNVQIEVIAIDPESFDLSKVNNPDTLFLRSTFGTYEYNK